jgi:hypothetical protein
VSENGQKVCASLCLLRPFFLPYPFSALDPRHVHHIIAVMVRYTATEIFQILYYARHEGEDISVLEQRYFQSQARASAAVDVSDDDASILDRIKTQMHHAHRCLAEEPWVQAFTNQYDALPQTTSKLTTTTLTQYALLAPEAANIQQEQATNKPGHLKRQSLTVRIDDITNRKEKEKEKSNSKRRSKDTTQFTLVKNRPTSSVRLSGREILAVQHSSFVSATLQFLARALDYIFATSTYPHYSINPTDFKTCTGIFDDGDGDKLWRFPCVFGDLTEERCQPSGDAVEPAALLNSVKELSKGRFSDGEPRTVGSFTFWLLTALLESNRASSATFLAPLKSKPDWYSVMSTVHHSPIIQRLGIHTLFNQSCDGCGVKTEHQDYRLVLPLQFSDSDPILGIDDLLTDKHLPKPNRCSCGSSLTTTLVRVRSCSEYLIVQCITATPSSPITYPMRNLNIGKIVSYPESEDTGDMLYELQSVVANGTEGYTTWTLIGEKWWEYNNHGIPTRVVDFHPVSRPITYTCNR